jgi:CubicO group peptidase (beta-lactamase class C family)
MTMNHITPEQKALSALLREFLVYPRLGLGLGIVTARHDVADVPGRFGWDGAFGTSLYVRPEGGAGRRPHDPAPPGPV